MLGVTLRNRKRTWIREQDQVEIIMITVNKDKQKRAGHVICNTDNRNEMR